MDALRKPISYRKHYLDLKSTGEADAFWRIVPKRVKLPELEKKDGWFVEKGNGRKIKK